jgi:hypothetical protein
VKLGGRDAWLCFRPSSSLQAKETVAVLGYKQKKVRPLYRALKGIQKKLIGSYAGQRSRGQLEAFQGTVSCLRG